MTVNQYPKSLYKATIPPTKITRSLLRDFLQQIVPITAPDDHTNQTCSACDTKSVQGEEHKDRPR